MKKIIGTVKYTTLLLLLAFTLNTNAQTPGGDGTGEGTPDSEAAQPEESVPFDFGLTAMIVAGAAYAGKKGYDKKKKENQPQLEK